MLSRRTVFAGALLPASVPASVGRRSCFGSSSLGLRVALPWVSDSRVMRDIAACGSAASAVTSALTIRSSRRRFAARLNSGVRLLKQIPMRPKSYNLLAVIGLAVFAIFALAVGFVLLLLIVMIKETKRSGSPYLSIGNAISALPLTFVLFGLLVASLVAIGVRSLHDRQEA